MPKCKVLSNFIFSMSLVLGACVAASAQMTIFNVPSTDVLPKKSAYVEADVITKPKKLKDGGFQTYGWRVVYGVGGKTEVGANVFVTRDELGKAGELQLSVKRTLYSNERLKFDWAGGAIFSTPIRDERGEKRYAYMYTNASKIFEKANGLRLTGGVYQVIGGGDDFGTKTGAIIGVEQPIKGRLSFVGDWASGNNKLGYVSGGFNWQFTPRQYVLAGYSVGNSGRGNNYLSIFYGYTF